jgi:hypothetical protein
MGTQRLIAAVVTEGFGISARSRKRQRGKRRDASESKKPAELSRGMPA